MDINNMTYTDYLGLVDRTRKQYPQWRYGQTLFNVLYRVRPDLSEQVRATVLDPFYQRTTDQVEPFLKFVQENW